MLDKGTQDGLRADAPVLAARNISEVKDAVQWGVAAFGSAGPGR